MIEGRPKKAFLRILTPSMEDGNMAITKDEIRHVARLARLDMKDSDLDVLAAQIDRILEYVNTISSVATMNVEPMSHAIELSNAFRQDRVSDGTGTETALANAPETSDNMFCVPRIIE